MQRTFNLGIGFVLAVAAEDVEAAAAALAAAGEVPVAIGTMVEPGTRPGSSQVLIS
jgi:phosphoribosylaminoimidazole (AIR) synthetase